MRTEQLIDQLAAELQPVRVLRPPLWRTALWFAGVGIVAAVAVALYARLDAVLPRLATPRVAIETTGAALTAIAAITAAFQLSLPDRSPRWVWLPLPFFLIWMGASGLGCLRNGLSLHGAEGFAGESPHCFSFIIAASVPLALTLFAMLRRARPIQPVPVAALGTLGVAATAAVVLQFFHPFDVTVIDLALHLAAIGLVVLIGTLWNRPLLAAGRDLKIED